MKANELMIGDFIRTIYTQKIIKVREIKQSCIYTNDNGYEYNEIEPIPLTSETLEKNFESESNIFGLQTYKLNENFNLEDRGDRFCLVRKCSDYNSSTFWVCDLMHLHQLQHALRLCGIEKTIEL